MTDTKTKPLSVTEAAYFAKSEFEKIRLTIIGEVSQLADKSGYKSVYFDIKDESASLSCKMWRNKYDKTGVKLSLGSLVQISGYFTIWPAKGDVKFEVASLSLAGEGELRQRVAQLAETLRKEGLMDSSRKIPLPAYPKKIGLVTSPRGAAVHDVLRTLRRRYPMGEVLLAGVPVEGKNAAEYLLQGLRCVYKAGAEVILLVRGGGSFEDLMPFNDETLCRAISKCPIPIITGIGHEPDNSIADMVADFRASTPTAAAESVAPDFESIQGDLDLKLGRMARVMGLTLQSNELSLDRIQDRPLFSDSNALLSDVSQKADYMADRLRRAIPGGIQRDATSLESFDARLARLLPAVLQENDLKVNGLHVRLQNVLPYRVLRDQESIDSINKRLMLCGDMMLETHQRDFSLAASRLNDLSPLAILGRGYSLSRDKQGGVVRSVSNVSVGDSIEVTVSDGVIDCTVNDMSVKANSSFVDDEEK